MKKIKLEDINEHLEDRHPEAQNVQLEPSALTAMSQADRCQFQLHLKSQGSCQIS